MGVRVLREQIIDGVVKRSVVSHMAKATRGAVARDLLVHDVNVATPDDLARALKELGYAADLNNATIEVVVTD